MPTGPSGEVRIVRVTEDDWARLRDIRLRMLADYPLGFLERLPEARARTEHEWRGRARGGHRGVPSAAFAAVVDGAWVAHAGGFVGVPGVVTVYGVYVEPAHRGRGLVADLVAAVERWGAAEHGARTVALEVHEDNRRARAAYRRLGFVETGETSAYPLEPGGTELGMARPVSSDGAAGPSASR